MDEEAIEKAALAFIKGLFDGTSAVKVERQVLGEAGGDVTVWTIRLVTPNT